jgi:transposase-like protein
MVERVKRKQRRHEHAGQPTKYNADHMPQFARFMCQRGAVMSEVADAFNVSTRTLFNWLNLHPELHDAVQVGVDTFNSRVERALAERAIGFWVTIKEEVRDEQGKVIQPEQRQYYPPDTRAIIFFLKNRMRDKYRNVQDHNVNARAFKSPDDAIVKLKLKNWDVGLTGVTRLRGDRSVAPGRTGTRIEGRLGGSASSLRR